MYDILARRFALTPAQADSIDYLVLAGPTGSGKTECALSLCKRYPDVFEIISMDSVQVYCGLDIGSAKVSMAQRAKVPHHLLDICLPDTRYTAAQFCLDATTALTAIRQRGKIALIVGGTFLYLQAFVYGLSPMPDITEHARNQLAMLKTDGVDLWAFLSNVDAARAELRLRTICVSNGHWFILAQVSQCPCLEPVLVLCIIIAVCTVCCYL